MKFAIYDNLSALLASPEWEGLCQRHESVTYLTDSNVFPLVKDLIPDPIVIPAGESHKSLDTAAAIWTELIRRDVKRSGLLVNVGGGMVTDIGGFCAAAFKRGIDYANIPTTLLASVDAAIGGKTGIDFAGLKNEIGAFRMPEFTAIPLDLQRHLPDREYLSGMGEVVKYSLIDPSISLGDVEELLENRRNLKTMRKVVEQCILCKVRITEEDPLDNGLRRALNLGHTFGHAMESHLLSAGRPMPHGVCVAHGLVAELVASLKLKGLPSEMVIRYANLVKLYFPPMEIACDDLPKLADIALHDKKNLKGGEISFVAVENDKSLDVYAALTPSAFRESLEIWREL